tara:strand:- start:26061 stop:26180 length:120 start_codon:yes stop_codon:yes gene_type:complete
MISESAVASDAVTIERGLSRCASDLKDYVEKRYQQSCAQ